MFVGPGRYGSVTARPIHEHADRWTGVRGVESQKRPGRTPAVSRSLRREPLERSFHQAGQRLEVVAALEHRCDTRSELRAPGGHVSKARRPSRPSRRADRRRARRTRPRRSGGLARTTAPPARRHRARLPRRRDRPSRPGAGCSTSSHHSFPAHPSPARRATRGARRTGSSRHPERAPRCRFRDGRPSRRSPRARPRAQPARSGRR